MATRALVIKLIPFDVNSSPSILNTVAMILNAKLGRTDLELTMIAAQLTQGHRA